MTLSHATLEPTDEAPSEWQGWVALLMAAFVAVIVFIPSDGRIAVPIHTAIEAVLGRAAFVFPLGLAVLGVLVLARRFQPTARLPARRLVGVLAILVAMLGIEHLLPRSAEESGTGLVGQWLTTRLSDLLGDIGSSLVLAAVLGLGIALVFVDLAPRKVSSHPSAER